MLYFYFAIYECEKMDCMVFFLFPGGFFSEKI